MSLFRHDSGYRKRSSKKRVLLYGFILFVCVAVAYAFVWYQSALSPVNVNDDRTEVVTIEEGMNEMAIGVMLERRQLIRSGFAFELYSRLSRNAGKAQAGSYELSQRMSVKEVFEKITSGEVAVNLVTILPARRIDQIKSDFIEQGYTAEEVEKALEPTQYENHPALIDKPPKASLEGYLYPESFQTTASTPLSIVITASLDQMSRALTDELRSQYEKRGLSLHEAIILSSIVEREVARNEDRIKVAQVFLTRYQIGMMLGSDPTALYGALQFGIEPSVFADTPYNTRLYEGLPPGPINNVSEASLRALAFPAETDFLYFVSGDDGNTYFSRTLDEHEALTRRYCIELCRSY